MLGWRGKISFDKNIHGLKIEKALLRCVLLSGNYNENDWMQRFTRYVQSGITYIEQVYSKAVLDEVLAKEIASDELTFMLYMRNAQQCQKYDLAEYATALRQALQAMPGMMRGIEFLFRELEKQTSKAQQEQFTELLDALGMEIGKMVAAGQREAAEAALNEAEAIVGKNNDQLAELKAQLKR